MDNFSATAHLLPGAGAPVAHVGGGGGLFDITAIPGFDVVQKLLLRLGMDTSLLVTLGMSLTLLTSLFSFFTYSISSVTALTRFISANLVSSATIHSSDVTYLYVMRWLAVNRISTDCRLFCVTSRKNPMSHAVKRYSSYGPYGDGPGRNDDDDDEDVEGDDGGNGGGEEDRLGPKLKYTPAPGFLYFWYKKHLIVINRKLDLSYYTGDIPDETMASEYCLVTNAPAVNRYAPPSQVLTTIGRSPTLLRELLSEARREYLLAQSKKTMVYTISPTPFAQKTWDQGRHRPSREISTVILPTESKGHLLRDVKEYLNPVTARWYAQRGLPYRRGYLFYGPPGTGKTSLSLALAGELKVPLYILSLSTGSLTDETLTMLFVGLPRKCIVLLEDIDCAGVQRNNNRHMDDESDQESSEEEEEEEEEGQSDNEPRSDGVKAKSPKPSKEKKRPSKSDANPSSSGQQHRPPRMSVSFSGLLNAIDGVASHEGRILIMTTNHRERLDPALIRPGRVDMQIEFGYAGRNTLGEIFRELYSRVDGMDSATIEEEEEVFGGEEESLLSSMEKTSTARSELDRQAQYTATIADLAEKFADMIPVDKFTPAEIQGFLMSYKRAPKRAIRKIPEWLNSKPSAAGEKGSRRAKNKHSKKRSPKIIKSEEAPEPTRQPDVVTSQSIAFQGVVHNSAGGFVVNDLQVDMEMVTRAIQQIIKENVGISHSASPELNVVGLRRRTNLAEDTEKGAGVHENKPKKEVNGILKGEVTTVERV